MPNVHFSFRRGAGDVPEILYGKVEIKPTLAFARGTSLVLPAPTTLDLVNGEATANNVYPTPAPVAGQVEWAYRVKAIDTRGQSFEWMVGVPDSTGTVEFTSLPRYFETKPPLFGKGEKGDPGEAAKITVGTTTSGTTPSVTNSGTNQNAVLNFVLPKGDKGDKGDSSTYLALNAKVLADPPSSYPAGMSVTRTSSPGSGWPYSVSSITTSYAGAAGTGWQVLTDYNSTLSPVLFRRAVGGTADTWGDFRPLFPSLATPSSDGLMASADKKKLDDMLGDPNTKTFAELAGTYPDGFNTTRGASTAGWPNRRTDGGETNVGVHTFKSRGVMGGTVQLIADQYSNTTPLKYRVSDSSDWSDTQTLMSQERFDRANMLNFLDFGGVGDGVTDNRTALVNFVTILSDRKKVGFIPNGDYVISGTVVFPSNASDFGLVGESKLNTRILFRPTGTPSAATGLSGVSPVRMVLANFMLDGGASIHGVAGHGMSFRDSESCLFDDLHVVDHGNSAIMNFSNNDVAGTYGRNVVRNTSADGKGNSNNGFLFVNMEGCYFINVVAKGGGQNSWNTPSSGIQLKNRCTNSHIINCAAYNYKDGFGLGGDTDEFGPMNNTLIGAYAYDCHISLSMGSAVDNQIEVFSTRASRSDVRLSANCANNVVRASIDGHTKSEASIYFGSNFNSVTVPYVPQGITKLATFVVGSRYNKLLAESRYASSGQNITSLVENLSEQTNNYVGSLDVNYRTSTLTPDGTTALYFFDPTGKQNYIGHAGTNQTFSFRSDGSNIFTVRPTDMSPGSDNLMALGTSVRRFTQLYAVSGTINTSDEREKRDISTELSPELRAWAKVDFVKFKWKEAVDRKGKKARWHFGVIAQDVKKAFESEGLDPFEYGILCYDEWEEQTEVVDEEGKVNEPYIPAGNRYGVRYEEALALESAYLRSQLIK